LVNSASVIRPFSMRSLVNASVCAKEEAINSPQNGIMKELLVEWWRVS